MDPSIIAFGLTGLVNSAAVGAVIYFFLPAKVVTFYFSWWAFMGVTIVHGLFWSVLFVLWPMVYLGDVNVLDLVDVYT